MSSDQRTLLYFADPMCSWCWGFAPVIERVVEAVGDRGEVLVVMGGLAPGTRAPLTPRLATSIREHWEHVREATGQPFDFRFFDRESFEYDTEPACRAVVAAPTGRPTLLTVGYRPWDQIEASLADAMS